MNSIKFILIFLLNFIVFSLSQANVCKKNISQLNRNDLFKNHKIESIYSCELYKRWPTKHAVAELRSDHLCFIQFSEGYLATLETHDSGYQRQGEPIKNNDLIFYFNEQKETTASQTKEYLIALEKRQDAPRFTQTTTSCFGVEQIRSYQLEKNKDDTTNTQRLQVQGHCLNVNSEKVFFRNDLYSCIQEEL